MKKMLGILGGLGLVATAGATTMVVSGCTIGGDEVRDPKNLSQFKETDFYSVFKKLINQEQDATGKQLASEIKTVILDYFKANDLVVDSEDIYVKIASTIGEEETNIQDDEPIPEESLKKGAFHLYVTKADRATTINGNLDLKIENYDYREFKAEDLLADIKAVGPDATVNKKILDNQESVAVETLAQHIPNLINESIKNVTETVGKQGQDYSLRFRDSKGNRLTHNDQVNLVTDGVQVLVTELTGKSDWDWTSDGNELLFTLKINDNKFEILV